MGAPVDRDLAGGQSVAPFAQRMRRQLHRRSVGAELHSAPVQCLDMHRPECLGRPIAHIRGDREPALLLLSERLSSLFPGALAAQFRLIFLELKRSLVAGQPLQPTPQRVLGQTLLLAVFADPETAPTPRFDVQRPPLAARFVLEMFGSHRKFSTVAERPKWNDNTRGGRRAETGRLPADGRSQDKSGSPVEQQAIDLACVQPCRSVGGRAAIESFPSKLKDHFSTARAVANSGEDSDHSAPRAESATRSAPADEAVLRPWRLRVCADAFHPGLGEGCLRR